MTVALIDNGSLQPAAHRQLRALASELARRVGLPVHAVSWKHSDRIPPSALAGKPDAAADVPLGPDGRAWTLAPWMRAQLAAGEREFVFVPFFVSPQGAIGSALRQDLAALQRELGAFDVEFSAGLGADETLARIAVDRIREVIAAQRLANPPVIVVDHGGPSAESARIRNAVAAAVAAQLGSAVAGVAAASLEGIEYAHNLPLFADQLTMSGFNRGDVVVAPLFLAPGRHAGPRGDLAQIARAAEDRMAEPPLRCHFAELLGTHPLAAESLAAKLRATVLNRGARSDSTIAFAPAASASPATPAPRPLSPSSRLSA